MIQENLQEVFVIVCDCFASLEVSHFRVTFLYHQHSTLGCQSSPTSLSYTFVIFCCLFLQGVFVTSLFDFIASAVF